VGKDTHFNCNQQVKERKFFHQSPNRRHFVLLLGNKCPRARKNLLPS